MRTHDLAKQLQAVASALLEGPDVEMRTLGENKPAQRNAARTKRESNLAFFEQLDAVLSLSKPQWAALVKQFNLPIDVRDRDAARDVLGKLNQLFREHPEELTRIRNQAAHANAEANPELKAALSVLLGRGR